MALTANIARKEIQGDYNDFPVLATAKIYQGSLVGSSGGYARALVAADDFMGIAHAKTDNTSGSSGDIDVKVRFGTFRMEVTLASIAITDIGTAVYATDDATFTLTSSGNSLVGQVSRFVGTNTCEVEFTTLA